MDNLFRKRALPSIYVSKKAFTTPLQRDRMENGGSLSNRPRFGDNVTSSASDDGQSHRRVTFNIGGTIFQTTEKVFLEISEKNFTSKEADFLSKYYDESRGEFFFDRDPEVFRSVLNYWRTGKLHIPTTMCGPQIIDEMEFWGLSPMEIEPCCFNTYNSWIKNMHALHKLEKDRQLSHLKPAAKSSNHQASCVRRLSLEVWYLLTDPSYSRSAKIYAYISLFFVSLTIFSFCASTYSGFQITKRIYQPHNHHNTTARNNTLGAINNGSTSSTDSQNPAVTNKSKDNNDNKKRNNNINPLCQPFVPPRKPSDKSKDYVIETEIHPVLCIIDIVCLVLFTLEYLTRLVCAPKRLSFIVSFTAIVDLLAIMPDYVEFLVFALYPENSSHSMLQFMPFLRLMRVFRIGRLAQRVPGLWIMIYTLRASFKELSLMLMFLLVGTLFFSSVIYFVDDQTIFESIPHSFWWAIVTMTTVGYGDLTPTTAPGQIVGSVTAVCGVLLVGFTIPALVNNFITYCQFVEFAMRDEATMEENVRRVSERDKGKCEAAVEAGQTERKTKVKEGSVSDTTLESPTNDVYCPLTLDNNNS